MVEVGLCSRNDSSIGGLQVKKSSNLERSGRLESTCPVSAASSRLSRAILAVDEDKSACSAQKVFVARFRMCGQDRVEFKITRLQGGISGKRVACGNHSYDPVARSWSCSLVE
jgi:hypothetical protein